MNGIPSPAQGVWYLGPLPIRAYAMAILLGIVVSAWILGRRYRARTGPDGVLTNRTPAPAEVVSDVLLWAVGLGIVGARIYHVFSSPEAYFGPNGDLLQALRIWEGGLGIWGAVAGGALGAWIALRRIGLRLSPFADAAAPALLVAQAIGRLGNYFNQELFGAPTTLPWGLQIDAVHAASVGSFPPGTLFQPTFLYELLWCLTMAAVLVWVDRRFQLRHGRLFWLYVALYTLGRVWIEMLRIDDAEIVLGLRLNVWTSIVLFVAALVAFVVIGVRTRGVPDAVWLPGREPEPEATEDSSSSADSEGDAIPDGVDPAADRDDTVTASAPAGGADDDAASIDSPVETDDPDSRDDSVSR